MSDKVQRHYHAEQVNVSTEDALADNPGVADQVNHAVTKAMNALWVTHGYELVLVRVDVTPMPCIFTSGAQSITKTTLIVGVLGEVPIDQDKCLTQS